MTIDDTIARIKSIGIIPVIRAISADEGRRAVDAILAGGISIVEITMTVPGAPAIVRDVVRDHGTKILVGAGTVISAKQAQMCLDAGVEFLVSPGISLPVMQEAARQHKLAIPGALTPTEVIAARDAGAQLIKLFPCGNLGGPKYLKSLRGPFPDVFFIPTGGVNLSNATDYIHAGAFALGVGGELVDLAALRNNHPEQITTMAKSLVSAVRAAHLQASAPK
jgi:2-dehydro-3-deoxyphosphogluconate aldolase / (4S)-4-hydroxy-2-oxoglutarate aldolase